MSERRLPASVPRAASTSPKSPPSRGNCRRRTNPAPCPRRHSRGHASPGCRRKLHRESCRKRGCAARPRSKQPRSPIAGRHPAGTRGGGSAGCRTPSRYRGRATSTSSQRSEPRWGRRGAEARPQGLSTPTDGAYQEVHPRTNSRAGACPWGRRIARIMRKEGLAARGTARPRRRHGSWERRGIGTSRQQGQAGLRARSSQLPVAHGRVPVLDTGGQTLPLARSALLRRLHREPNDIGLAERRMANSMFRMTLATTLEDGWHSPVIRSSCGCCHLWPE